MDIEHSADDEPVTLKFIGERSRSSLSLEPVESRNTVRGDFIFT